MARVKEKGRDLNKGDRERGRPFSPETHQAILAAVTEILSTMRYADPTMDRVAAEAGVGKAAIYRRWEGKAELVVDAIRQFFEASNPHVPSSGDAEADVVTFLGNTARMLTKSPAGRIIRNIISELDHEKSLRDLMAELETERRWIIYQLLKPLSLAGDQDELIAMAFGPLHFRWLVSREPIDDHFIRNCVRALIRSMHEQSGGSHAR